MARVAVSPVWSHSGSAPTPIPWVPLGRVIAGATQILGLVAVFWLLVALPGVLSARDSTIGGGGRPAATAVARR